MKSRNLIAPGTAIWAGLILSAAAVSSTSSRNIAEFEIEVTVDSAKNEVRFECIDGCAWETLSFGCGKEVECTSSIDEYGTPAE